MASLSRCRALLAFISLALLAPIAAAAPESGRGKPVHACQLKGVLTVYSSDFLSRAIAEAHAAGAQALVVTLDTPGGLLEPTKEMVQSILNAPLAVAVHVAPPGASASSAGTFLTIAAHVAAMAPGTNIGAAHPVSVVPTGANDAGTKTMMEKVTNDTVSYIRGVAAHRGRDTAWVEKAVRDSVSITAKEALEKKVIDLVADDREKLLAAMDGRTIALAGGRELVLATVGAPVVVIEMTARERLLATVAQPNIAYVLLLLGLAGIAFEVTHPGATLPGVVGVVSMGLALIAFKALPLSYTGLLMLLFGLAFLIAEANAPTHGVLGLGGIACLTVGSYLLFDAPEGLRVSWDVIVAAVGTASFLFLFLMSRVLADLRRPVVSGREGLLAQLGVAREDFMEAGTVLVEGEVWRAVNRAATKIAAGDRVRIHAVEEGRLIVERATESTIDAGESLAAKGT